MIKICGFIYMYRMELQKSSDFPSIVIFPLCWKVDFPFSWKTGIPFFESFRKPEMI